MKKVKLVVGLIMVLAAFIANLSLEIDHSIKSNASISFFAKQAIAGDESSVTVPCKDTENYGSGIHRDRICLHGTTVWCKYENYSLPATSGTCTFEN